MRVAVQAQFVACVADAGEVMGERFESVAGDEEGCGDVVTGEEG